jgi:hypothetical protein
MAQYNFGLGGLYLVDNETPNQATQVGVLKDVTLDISFDTKELRGSYTFPVDIAKAAGKIEGKAKFAQISGRLINEIIQGTLTAGATVVGSNNESGTIPGSSAYTITVSNSATWTTDLGVYDVTSSKFMSRVTSSPSTGQYSVAAGVYTFAAADASHNVQISYAYTSTSGSTVTLTNNLMGSGTTYVVHLYNTYKGKNVGVKLYAVTLGKYSFAMKNEDFTDEDLDFMGFADGSGNVISLYTTE